MCVGDPKNNMQTEEKIIQFVEENGQICVLTNKGRLFCQNFVEQKIVEKYANTPLGSNFINTGDWFEINTKFLQDKK